MLYACKNKCSRVLFSNWLFDVLFYSKRAIKEKYKLTINTSSERRRFLILFFQAEYFLEYNV